MFNVPAEIPVTMPVAEPTVANELLLLVQVPPVGDPLKVVVVDAHKEPAPVIEPDDEFTVMPIVE